MTFGMVSEIGQGMGGDRRREIGSFGGKCGASHCISSGDFVA